MKEPGFSTTRTRPFKLGSAAKVASAREARKLTSLAKKVTFAATSFMSVSYLRSAAAVIGPLVEDSGDGGLRSRCSVGGISFRSDLRQTRRDAPGLGQRNLRRLVTETFEHDAAEREHFFDPYFRNWGWTPPLLLRNRPLVVAGSRRCPAGTIGAHLGTSLS
ncbi:hypothetical protein PS1_036981 [Malus domestica]